MAELIIQSGKLQGKRLVLPQKEMIVGRDDDCDMRIASSLVSRKHCSLKSTREGIVVSDLGSQNGTHVNDVPINQPTLLRAGDVLRIGAILLSVPAQPKPKSASGQADISEADIADWLTDSGSNYAGTDTAEIATFTSPTQAPAPTPAPPSKSAPAKAQTAKVLSVKDEAAEVIRKHWESVKAKQKN
jgi:pSer/pThr/pTyr-binding forkhead associated (FHA) protein